MSIVCCHAHLSQMDSNSETLDNEEVMKCLNSFNHAISLDPDNLTILIERACFCYEVHSYASRIIKKVTHTHNCSC